MSPLDLEKIFEPVVQQVVGLIKEQIVATNRKITAVLLVGGFGQNNYLKERLRSALTNSANKIEVIQPPHAWTAVVQGAVMKGLATYDSKLAIVHVGPRKARKHYGVWLNQKYDTAVHERTSR
jgi:tRNA A37 threonylcarbamoyltransferase TsaD